MILWSFLVFLMWHGSAFSAILMRHEGLATHTDFSMFCKKDINLYVQTKEAKHYDGDRSDLEYIINASRKELQKRCPGISNIVINGSLSGRWYYFGKSKKDENWAVKGRNIKNDEKYYEPFMFPEDPDSKYKLALMYIEGERLVVDYGEASTLLKEAAKEGHADAQYTLGLLYEEGLVPYEQNSKYQAEKWVQKAADQGHAKAMAHLRQQNGAANLAEQKEIEAEKSSRRAGVVYKSDRFWMEFSGFDVPRKVFDGRFSGLSTTIDFKNFYIDFVSSYSGYCHNYLPSVTDRRASVSTEISKDEYGFETSRREVGRSVVDIDPRFTAAYDQYGKDVAVYNKTVAAKALLGMMQNMRSKGLGGSVGDVLDEMKLFEMNKFFKKVSCGSATMQQMQENMLRVATGKPSLQSAGVVLKNAAKESDSVERSVKDKNFEEACLAYHGKRSPDNDFEQWCSCLNREARKVMTPAEMAGFADDFGSYYRDIDNKAEGLHDPRWRLQGPLNACRR